MKVEFSLRIKNSFKSTFSLNSTDNKYRFEVQGTLIFCNFLGLKNEIMKMAVEKKDCILDLTQCDYIDHSVMEQIDEIRGFCQHQGTPFTLILSPNQHPMGQSTLSARKKAS
jgi:MFS superfamily sulfate permease-like transporter